MTQSRIDRTRVVPILSLCCMTLIAGCGGSSGSGGAIPLSTSTISNTILASAENSEEEELAIPSTGLSAAEVLDRGELALRQLGVDGFNDIDGAESLRPASSSDLPISGRADYSGYAEVLIGTATSAQGLMGSASVTADFETRSVSGALSSFYVVGDPIDVTTYDFGQEFDRAEALASARRANGTLTLSNGVFETAGSGEAGMSADLDGTLTYTGTTADVQATVGGVFVEQGEGIVGLAQGLADVSSGGTTDRQEVFGAFIVAR